MIGMKKAASISVAAGLIAVGFATPSVAATPGPAHHVSCHWNHRAGTPYSPGANSLKGYVQVMCTDKLDEANTQAQLQIFRGGDWRNQGAGVTSHSHGSGRPGRVMIHVNDTSTKRIGNWRYRTRGKHYGQHGNVWQLPAYYSPTRMLWRRG